MAFDDSSNARRKRKLAAKIKKGCKQLKAAYRADRRKAEAAALAKKNAALNLTPEDITAILEAAKELREQQRGVAA